MKPLTTSAICAIFLIALSVRAATYIVTDTDDTTKITSLRGAVMAANREGRRNTIILGENSHNRDFRDRFNQETYSLTIPMTSSTVNENGGQVGDVNNPIVAYVLLAQVNGGFTPTCALLSLSPAIDQGNCFGIHSDQRGVHRPHVYSFITNPLVAMVPTSAHTNTTARCTLRRINRPLRP